MLNMKSIGFARSGHCAGRLGIEWVRLARRQGAACSRVAVVFFSICPFWDCVYCGPPLNKVICRVASAIDGHFAKVMPTAHWSEGSLGVCRIVLADVAMICTGLFGALSINNYRWGYYVISCLFFLIVLWGLVGPVAKVGCMLGNLPQRLGSCVASNCCPGCGSIFLPAPFLALALALAQGKL